MLPMVTVAAGAGRSVFLDAGVPASEGETLPPDFVRAAVADLRRGDKIAAWPTWWDPADLAAELPDDELGAVVSAEAPELPADFFDVPVPVPPSWSTDVLYVQLSPSYDPDSATARERGWTVRGTGTGSHLDVASAPAHIADLIS
ncbi:hypothetical protein JQX13_46080 [Archangium violaceum]|uniref:hypothetical protein n=1 Tax=Archangium violaceum TaxID=83451 RepID=UPI00193B803B|nr:hypothetical protein [Archangium violaceum]QRK07332.1 hypothetical protein JQX13_46080 [Archangium violaceum]